MAHDAFVYQPPTPEMVEKITAVRDKCSEMLDVLYDNVPECAELTLAIRKLEEVSMWANKAIVFDGRRYL
jgi:hypothetical protein